MRQDKFVKVTLIYEAVYFILFGIWKLLGLFNVAINCTVPFVILSIVSYLLIAVSLVKVDADKRKNMNVIMEFILTTMILTVTILG